MSWQLLQHGLQYGLRGPWEALAAQVRRRGVARGGFGLVKAFWSGIEHAAQHCLREPHMWRLKSPCSVRAGPLVRPCRPQYRQLSGHFAADQKRWLALHSAAKTNRPNWAKRVLATPQIAL